MSGFNNDYVEVHERIAKFYERHPEGRLTTLSASMSMDPDGTARVWVQAAAYRTPDDPHPGIGWSYMAVPGSTNFTRGSELENTETSAWGRAIAAVGIEVKRGIASAQEVRNKQSDAQRPAVSSLRGGAPASDGPWSGPVSKGRAPVDGNLRQTPDGPTFGFVVMEPIPGSDNGRRTQVLATGPLADALALACADGLPKEATVWGELVMVPWEKDGKQMPPYRRVLASKVSTADFTVPAAPGPSGTGWGGLSPEDEAAIWGGDAA